MPSFSTVHGGQYDTKYVTFQVRLHAAFVAETCWGGKLKSARTPESDRTKRYIAAIL